MADCRDAERRLADAKPVHLGHAGEADGRWRLYPFAGIADTGAARALCDFLAESDASPVRRHTPAGLDIDALFDVRAAFSRTRRSRS